MKGEDDTHNTVPVLTNSAGSILCRWRERKGTEEGGVRILIRHGEKAWDVNPHRDGMGRLCVLLPDSLFNGIRNREDAG